MGAPEWIALVGPMITLIGVGIGAIVKLTRLIDAVNELKTELVGLFKTDKNHERRIRRLEQARRQDRRRNPG